VAVTAFTTGAYSNSQQRLAYVKSVADLAKVRGVDVVNLAVDWNDVEPSKGTIDPLLETMIWEIKSRGLLCVLRVYANVQGLWQAWPIWLNSVETYPVAGKKEIFPWDNTYQSVWSEFQGQLASKFASWNAQPDGVQITIGGSFGEQVLGDYDSSKWPWPTFTDKLFAAEKWHVDTYIATMGSVAKDHIAVLNSLASSNPAYEDQVGVYARNKGVGWIESNAGACFLSEKPYGPDNAKMLARFQGGGARIFLEDESGKWSCPEVGLGASLSGRVALMKTLQSKYSINFSAVSISGDNDIYDVVGIANLKAMLGI
jgi:hypothetical protein